ncbi:MAG: hypothetical protein WAN48_08585 [Actinomycetes bacterium]
MSSSVSSPESSERSPNPDVPTFDAVHELTQAELQAQSEVDEADALESAIEVPIDDDEYR